jgi:class 3 adenylate cyclase
VTSRPPHTRGFLFADLRGYSRFTEERGDAAARDLIRRYRDLVRAEIAAHEGAEIRTEGDSFYVVFESVTQAVRAGLAIRAAAAADQPGAPPIKVGIGVHAGEVEDGEDGIVASAVNIAARVCSAANAGEVLVTDTVRSLTRGALPISFAPHGRRRLKGISDPVTLFSVTESAEGRRPRRSPLPLAAAAFAAVSVAVVVVTWGATRDEASADGGLATPDQQSAAASPSREAPVRTPVEDEFPNTAEAALLDRLPSSVAASCERADPAEVPTYQREIAVPGGGRPAFLDVPIAMQAGLSCLTQGNRVHFWHAFAAQNIDASFAIKIGKWGVPQGTCATGTGRVWETWQAGAHAGKLLCHTTTDGRAVLEWTYGDEPIYAIAERRDGDRGALLAWWREDGRLLSR